MDRAYSSGINIENWKSFFKYIQEIKQQIINSKSENILIIWAAWFTLPNELSEIESIKNIDVLDIDKDLKDISEKYFLQKKLSKKINFYPQSARFYLNKLENKKYDTVVVDAYSWQSLPPQILTIEFFEKLNDISNDIYLNIIIDENLDSNFSIKLL
jgi:spermidine synthase